MLPELLDARFKRILRGGFLRRMNYGAETEYYFIHFTFQEYFAAGTIARLLKQTGTLGSPAYEDLRRQIITHHYNSRQLVCIMCRAPGNDGPVLQHFFDYYSPSPEIYWVFMSDIWSCIAWRNLGSHKDCG